MKGFPSKVLIVSDYPNYHFNESFREKIDFVLSCGDHGFHILEEIYELYKKPIFAVKGNHDSTKPFPPFVMDIHSKVVQHRNWLIGGLQGVPCYKSTPGAYEWDDFTVMNRLINFPYVDIFICHSPVHRHTDKPDYAHIGSEAILKYIKEKQPKYVYHGHIHSKMGTMIDMTAVVSVFGAKIFTLS